MAKVLMDKCMLKATANWLAQVDYDIATAEQMLHAGRYIYVIFMSHMASEKALKALVTEETQKHRRARTISLTWLSEPT
jgi:HEPN domain-containing protein